METDWVILDMDRAFRFPFLPEALCGLVVKTPGFEKSAVRGLELDTDGQWLDVGVVEPVRE